MFKSNKTANKKVKRQTRAVTAGPVKDTSGVRLVFVAVVFAGLWAALWGRAWYVQLIDGPRLAAMASRQHHATELVTGQRGDILDRNGLVLARSADFKSVFVRPVEIENRKEAAKMLANALGRSYAQMLSKVSRRSSFVWVSREVDDKAAARIREASLAGVYLTTEYSRLYPYKQLAGRLIGFVGTDDKGLEGLERAFDKHLTGQSTRQVVQRDAAGRRLYMDGAGFASGLKGKDLRLTVDANIQFFAEDALASAVRKYEGTWGGCMVVDAQSGDILAWAEYPPFNPNAYKGYSAGMWRNRLAMDALEPGSTVKPFLIAAALDDGLAKTDSLFFCENGRWKLHDVTIRDTKKHQWLTLDKVLRYSSNIGMAKLGLEMGAARYHDYLTRLGFGERPELPLPGVASGLMRQPGQWREVDLATASFGQGFAVTGAQLARAFMVLANGGVSKPLRLVIDDNAPEAPAGERIFSEESTRKVLEMMRETVEGDGTGRAADILGLEIGGKTGTAQKASKGKSGYGDEYVASFVGLVPAMNPKHIVLVTVDNPRKNHYGSVVAAPVFKSVVTRTWAYLGMLPEGQEEYAGLASGDTPSVSGRIADLPAHDEQTRSVAQNDVELGVVPNVVGRSLRSAMEIFARKGLIPEVKGMGSRVQRQKPEAGSPWPENITSSEYVLWLTEQS
ncbi:penicillin-binding transpeptidase domain-containing protein [Oleidesulfovibrio sp.]|uniref:penicillin-binding transpeptidase domain-containing protein n=1 Tax=Oleidesulfovibrio sp. TaxID=2909707 RepID=UPI003A88F1BD